VRLRMGLELARSEIDEAPDGSVHLLCLFMLRGIDS
jgi:hypothetical protein